MPLLDAPPDKTLAFVAEMDLGEPDVGADGPWSTAARCTPRSSARSPVAARMRDEADRRSGADRLRLPDAPRGRPARQPDHCPQCGMKLLPARAAIPADGRRPTARATATATRTPAASSGKTTWSRSTAHDAGEHALEARRPRRRRREPRDRLAVPRRRPGEDPAGQRDGLRPPDAPPVPHPRRRRFLVLARDGAIEPNLVWKDTVLVRTGETVDIVLDVTNPGRWMAHCHIAEHHESGMMFSAST